MLIEANAGKFAETSGIKHAAMTLGHAMSHLGYTIPPQADCGWLGEAGPGPSYGDEKKRWSSRGI